MGFTSSSGRSSYFSSSTSAKINTSAPLSVSLSAIFAPDIFAPFPIAPLIDAFTPVPSNDLFKEFMQAYMVNSWSLIPAQAQDLVEFKELNI